MEKLKRKFTGESMSAIVLSSLIFLQNIVPGIVHASDLIAKSNLLKSNSQIYLTEASSLPSPDNALNVIDEVENSFIANPNPGGPDQPEVQSFTPIGTSDLVDPFTGDFSYNIPLLDVDGYPINIAYQAGATMDQEATWVGLGWNLNPGVVNRVMRGIPDDFDGSEKIVKEFNMKPNWTAGTSLGVGFELAGFDFAQAGTGGSVSLNLSLGVNYNNYAGFGAEVSVGSSFSAGAKNNGNGLTAGLGLSGSSQGGATVSPSVGIYQKGSDESSSVKKGLNVGTSINSRGGVSNVSMSYSRSYEQSGTKINKKTQKEKSYTNSNRGTSSGSFNIGMSSYTPMISMPTNTFAFTGSFSLGADATTSDPSFDFSGYYSRTWLKEKSKSVSAFGYMNAQIGQWNNQAMMDFNRENDGVFTKNTPALPNVALTYDIYTVSGQGVGGSYRPYRPDIGYVFDTKMKTSSTNASVGGEVGLGLTFKAGIDVAAMYSESKSEPWNDYTNFAAQRAYFNSGQMFFREANEMSVDPNPGHFNNIGGAEAVRFNNNSFASLQSVLEKDNNAYVSNLTSFNKVGGEKRNQVIYTLNNKELIDGFGVQPIHPDSYGASHSAVNHHIAQFTTLNTEGTRYVYGIAAYSHHQKNVSFAVGAANGQSGLVEICGEGRVAYSGNDASINNERGLDNHYNSITTPAFAHSYLLTSVLNADYIDVDDVTGPSKGDLGGYMKFEYKKINNYQWRNPVNLNEAFFDEGLNGDNSDDKGHYMYGEKELWYVTKILTKNHIAVFYTSPRKDGHPVIGETGGIDGNELLAMQQLDSIQLFTIPDYESNLAGVNPTIAPLKVVHFEYDYSLCPGYDQTIGSSLGNGKLTLKKIYFTYQGSNKGRYTPYEFDYSEIHDDINPNVSNPSYDMKSIDRWGSYKENEAGCVPINQGELAPSDFPYVGSNKQKVDKWVTSWNLSTIHLPSGGKIEVDYESDDYAFVQHKKATQMLKIIGVETSSSVDISGDALLSSGTAPSERNRKIYVEIIPGHENPSEYVVAGQQIYFRTLMKFENGRYDFVPGYATVKTVDANIVTLSSGKKAFGIGLEGAKLKDSGNSDYNPISVAAIQFGRIHLSRYLSPSNQGNVDEGADLLDILGALAGAFTSFGELFTGPNFPLWSTNVGRELVINKSWVRLTNPNEKKLGGGHRVKEIRMFDAWDALSSSGDEYYYGQSYEYTLEDNVSSSGVAAYEPQIGGDENVWRQPLSNDTKYLLAPDARNYQETPFGEQFFPSPRVGYSRVTIKDIARTNVSRTATGKVVHDFYTAKDFPTIVKRTSPQIERFKLPIFAIFFSMSIDEMSASQGFVVENNDMHGKPKGQKVFAEGQSQPITKVEYYYHSESIVEDGIAANHLTNEVTTIQKNGSVSQNTIGRTYEAVADFRQSETKMVGGSVNINLNYTLPVVFVPMILGSGSFEKKAFRSATFTKVIERFGLLKNTVATDLGSEVETNNLAYDAETGSVLLTQTTTDFNDKVYNFSYPAHWYYDGMGQAYRNVGLQIGSLTFASGNAAGTFASNFVSGDEVGFRLNGNIEKGWVTEVNNSAIRVLLKDGTPLNGTVTAFKVLRSGRRNIQDTPIGSVALRSNPLVGLQGNVFEKVLQAGAVEYVDEWRAFCECFLDENNEQFTTNPYVLGLKGTWRPKASYVHLAGRTQTFENNNSNIREDGVFTSYTPFYELDGGAWNINKQNWTYTSSVVEFSPYGQALETIDALDRYSASQFGYNQTLPIAVAANTRYRQLGFDGFEDYVYDNCSDNHFRLADGIETNVVDEDSHTGRKSIKVSSGSPVIYSTQLVTDCDPLIPIITGESNNDVTCNFDVLTSISTIVIAGSSTGATAVSINTIVVRDPITGAWVITNIPNSSSTTTPTTTTTSSGVNTVYTFQVTGATGQIIFDYTIVSGAATMTTVGNVIKFTVTNGQPLHVVVEATDINGCSEIVELNQ